MSISKFYLKFLKIALPLFIVTMPLQNRDIFTVVFSRIFPARLLLILIISTGLVSLFLWFWLGFGFKEKIKALYIWVRRDFVLLLLLILLIIRVVSVKSSLNLSASVSLLLFYLSMVSLYIIFKFIFEAERPFLFRLLLIHLITVSAVALFGLLQLILSFFGIILPGVLVGSAFVRIPATFYDANHLPAYLLTAFPTLFIYFFYAKKGYQKFFLAFLLAVFATVLLFTFSRSGFLSFSLAILILGFIFLKRRYWKKVLTISFVFAFAAVVIFLTSQTQLSIFKRLSSVLNVEDKSTVAHGLLYYGGLELLKESPVIGLGYGSFSEHFRRSSIGQEHAMFDTATQVRIPAHSIWLETLVETGILGFSVYLWLIVSVLEKLWQALKVLNNKRAYLLQLALLASLIGVLAGGLFYSYNLEFFWFFLFIVYFLSLGHLQPATGVRVTEEKNVLEDSEAVDWVGLFYTGLAFLAGVFLIFNGLGLVPVLPGDEGLASTIGKDIRRDWGYRALLWWLPKYQDQAVTLPPAPYWLNAIWTFLFNFGPSVPRFLPALFGLASVLIIFALSFKKSGWGVALTSFLLFLVSPWFLEGVRFGYVFGYMACFSSLVLLLVKQINEDQKYLLVPLAFVLGALSLFSYLGYILVLPLLLLYFCRHLPQGSSFKILCIICLVTSSFPLVWWLGKLGQITHRSWLEILYTSSGNIAGVAYFLLLPVVVYLASRIIYARFNYRFFALAVPVILLLFFISGTKLGNSDLSSLIQVRLGMNRDGRVPIYLLEKPLSDTYYYSEVPVKFVSLDELKKVLVQENYIFAILPGDAATTLKEQSIGSFEPVAVSGDLVLIEKTGKVY